MDRKDILITALRAAGAEIQKYNPSTVTTSVKSTAGDIVTAADIASERSIIATIQAAFPKDVCISEETAHGQELLNNANLTNITGWIIDPIDGTNNFKRDMAYSGISIGYIVNGVPILGGIFDPYRDLLYLAESGQGATCNGTPLKVSSKTDFDGNTRVCTSNSMSSGGTQANLARQAALGDVWADVLGSAVLIMADIAAARLDLYHHNGLKPWDNAAGFLLVQEAGGIIADLHGQPVTWLSNEVVMGNAALVDTFVARTTV